MKKLLIYLLTLSVIFIFTGCAAAKDDREVMSGADGKTSVILTPTENTQQVTDEVMTYPNVKDISEQEAVDIAYKALQEYDFSFIGSSIEKDVLTFRGCKYKESVTFFDTDENCVKSTKPVWVVTYDNVNTETDCVDISVNPSTGDVEDIHYHGD
ncbi:MAG: hypothetical protein K2L19_01385 [Eubacterium sp.]|nr:hypothetical protein [Eubacterium sp.]